jgi:hypothetical protein
MTAPGGVAPLGGDASEAVGYTYPSRSYNGPASTDRHRGIAPGARALEAPASPSTSTANRDRRDFLDASCGVSEPWHDLCSDGIPASGR